MNRHFILGYGVVAYGGFLVALLYLMGFAANMVVPKGVDEGVATSLPVALAINLGLILLFGVQHSVMARPRFKAWLTQYVPKPIERSTFVMATNLVLALMFWQWRPIPVVAWEVDHVAARALILTVSAMGWMLVLYSSFLINHFDLFGLRQVFLAWRDCPYKHVPMKVVSLYHFVRNPLMLGFLVAFWATPTMTAGHLLFTMGMTAYIFVGIYFEERGLKRELGATYRAYHKRTPMLIPDLSGRGNGPLDSKLDFEGERG